MGEHEQDGRLVRRVRRQLTAWSAGSMLVVVLLLGMIIYLAVATTLRTTSENLLRDRASLLRTGEPMLAGGPEVAVGVGSVQIVTSADAGLPGYAIEGPYAGTFGVVIPATAATVETGGMIVGTSLVPETAAGGLPAPDAAALAAAAAGLTTISENTTNGSPVRVLTAPGPDSSTVITVVSDMTAEVGALRVLAFVLVIGGLLAVLAAAVVGRLYAARALVPIRASLQRQREFAADTSHELRTPLAVIRAGVARIRQQPDAPVSAVATALDAVDAEAVRLAALVDDLLALARTDAGPADLDAGPVDLAEVAADALAALEPLAASRAVALALDVEPAPLTGDAARLRRLVTVLADNAIRHGRAGGSVRVTVRSGSLVVEDDGPGIPAADRAHVFDRFWRGAGAAAGGSGLGLAIAAWIAERHGGTISVGESALGGAKFSVALPVSQSLHGSGAK